MPLTDAQIAEEKAWADGFLKAFESSPEESASYYSDDATILRSGLPPVEGKDAILKFCKYTSKLFASLKTSNVITTIDEANNRIILTCDGTTVLAGDPEKQTQTARWAAILEKPLGEGEKKMTRDEAISDPSAIFKRIMETGIDVLKLRAEMMA